MNVLSAIVLITNILILILLFVLVSKFLWDFNKVFIALRKCNKNFAESARIYVEKTRIFYEYKVRGNGAREEYENALKNNALKNIDRIFNKHGKIIIKDKEKYYVARGLLFGRFASWIIAKYFNKYV